MKVAMSVEQDSDNARVDERFGRCRYFAVVDADMKSVTFLADDASEGSGAGVKAARILLKQRVMELCEHFRVKYGVVINKCDLNPVKTQEIKEFCRDKGIAVWGSIPYREDFLQAIDRCLPPVRYSKDTAEIIEAI